MKLEYAGPPRATIAISSDGRIAEDRVCVQCGYNLRTQLPGGNCPECNAPVAQSLVGMELVHASLPWLRIIGRGFAFLRAAVTIGLLAFLLPLVLALATAAANLGGWIATFLGLTFLAVLVLTAIGFFLATKPEPRLRHAGEGWSARRLTRTFAIALAALAATLKMLRLAFTGNALLDVIFLYAPMLEAVLFMAAAWTFAEYLVWLMGRTSDQKAIKSARQVRTAVRALAVLLAAQQIVQTIAQFKLGISARTKETLDDVVKIAGGFGTCLGFIVVIAGLIVVWKAAGIVKHTIAQAEARERSATG